MRTEMVDIYSDQTNAAILRHPGRRFPGVLVQGDSLSRLCQQADSVCAGAKAVLDDELYEEMDGLRETLRAYLNHYKVVLREHRIELPFSDDPRR